MASQSPHTAHIAILCSFHSNHLVTEMLLCLLTCIFNVREKRNGAWKQGWVSTKGALKGHLWDPDILVEWGPPEPCLKLQKGVNKV